MKRELDSYVLKLKDEGHNLSSGTFSISTKEAGNKLARWSLDFDHAWALFWVKSAVASKAGEIRFRLERDRVSVRFSPALDVSIDEITSAFCGNPEVHSEFLGALQFALWHLAFGEKECFKLQCPEDETSLHWSGELQFRKTTPSRFLVLEVTFSTPGIWNRVFHRTRAQASIHKVLTDRAFTSTIPVWLDGRRIDSLENCPGHNSAKRRHPLLAGELENCERFLLTYHAVESSKTGYRPQDASRASSVFWVQHGVVIDSQDLPIADNVFSLALFLPVQKLQTDISGFRLTDKARRKERARIKRALSRARSMLKKTAKDRAHEMSALSQNATMKDMWLVTKFNTAGAALLFFMAPVKSIPAIIGVGLMGLIHPLFALGGEEERINVINKSLKTFLAKLERPTRLP